MTYRYIADIVLEAKTPLRFGSGEHALLQDAPVQKDWNGLPMILGSSIAGVLRSLYSKQGGQDVDAIFGFQENKGQKGAGSRLIVSNALLLDEEGKVAETLLDKKPEGLLQYYLSLPVRQHVAITDKGTALQGGKFDEEIIYKGSRFKCRIEFLAESQNDEDKKRFESLLSLFGGEGIRLGAGSTKGFGRVALVENETLRYMCVSVESDAYKRLSSSLNVDRSIFTQTVVPKHNESDSIVYTLHLQPDSFFMFGSGFGNADNSADHTQVFEYVVDYDRATVYEQQLLIPATSVKGAISHRTAFYYNMRQGATIENGQGKVGEENEAVRTLFGYKKGQNDGQKGKVDFEDVFLQQFDKKIFDHVKIDRFTGGVIDGALFAEESVTTQACIELKLEVDREALRNDDVLWAFESALKEICTGMLPLGGMVGKGHGVFCGKLVKNGECLLDNLPQQGGCSEV